MHVRLGVVGLVGCVCTCVYLCVCVYVRVFYFNVCYDFILLLHGSF